MGWVCDFNALPVNACLLNFGTDQAFSYPYKQDLFGFKIYHQEWKIDSFASVLVAKSSKVLLRTQVYP